jgi:trimethylguanosine synthase
MIYHDIHILTPKPRYWYQRYSIFNFYDYDVRLTDDAWFGVTPEPVATYSPPPSLLPSPFTSY